MKAPHLVRVRARVRVKVGVVGSDWCARSGLKVPHLVKVRVTVKVTCACDTVWPSPASHAPWSTLLEHGMVSKRGQSTLLEHGMKTKRGQGYALAAKAEG